MQWRHGTLLPRERGGQPVYSSLAIETALALRLAFHRPLRQTEGMLRSIAEALKVDIAIPDHTTLSRCRAGVTILPRLARRNEPLHLLVDSTGLKMHGEGEWLAQQLGLRSRRRWRKLHLGLDAVTQEIVAAELTPDDVGDVSALPELLDQIDCDVASMTADGAYDGEAAYSAVADRHPAAAVVIPPGDSGSESHHDNAARQISRGNRGAWTYRLAAQFGLQPSELG
jgi:hypothetical protein